MFIFSCALIAGGMSSNTFLYTIGAGGVFLGIVYALIGFITAKDLIETQQRSKQILSDAQAMQKAVEKKKAFLKNLNMSSDIIDLSENEVREESEDDASIDIAPASGKEVMIISLRMGLAALIAAAVVIIPFVIIEELHTALKVSSAISLVLIAVALYIKSKLTGVSPWLGSLGNTLVTAIAGLCVYLLIDWIRV